MPAHRSRTGIGAGRRGPEAYAPGPMCGGEARTYPRRMSETRQLLTRVPAAVVVACVWVLTTVYLLLAQAQRMERPWGIVVGHPPTWTMDHREWIVLGFVGVLSALACLLTGRRPLWSMAALVTGALSLNYDIHSSSIGPDQYLPVCVALYFVAAASDTRRTTLAAAALACTGLFGHVAVCLIRGLRVDTAVEAVVLLATALAVVLGDSRRRERVHAQEARAQAAEQAVIAERLRIARELHDMVAHTIGVVALQAGAARLVVRSRPDDVQNALGVIEDASRETLAGLRRMLGALHDDSGPDTAPGGLDGIDQLVRRAREAGVRIDVDWRGVRRTLPAEIDLSAFRIVQESVTNVLKHSGARQCRVCVDFRGDGLAVEVVDSGTRAGGCGSGIGSGTGYGLAGMRERVELLRGEFSAGPRPEGGFRVSARIPMPTEAA